VSNVASNGKNPLQKGESPHSGGMIQVWAAGLAVLGPDKKRLFGAAALALISGLIETTLLYLIAQLAISIAGGESSVSIGGLPFFPEGDVEVISVVLGSFCLIAILVALTIPLARLLASNSARAIVRVRSRLVASYLQSSWSYRATEREAHFAQMVGEYSQRTELVVQQLGVVLVSTCQVVMLLGGALTASPIAAIVAAGGLIAIGAGLRPLSKGVRHRSVANSAENRGVVNDVQQSFRLAAEISSFNVGTAVTSALHQNIARAAEHLRKIRFTSRVVPTLYQYGALAVMLAAIGVLSVVGSGGTSGLAPVILLLIRALTYVRQLIAASQSSAELYPYLEATQREIAALEDNKASDGEQEVERFTDMELHEVTFEYVPGVPVLRDINLRLVRGDIVGLIGASGGGKTTLTQLILRLHHPTAGRITLNGIDFRDVQRASWTKRSAFVPQENKLILGTVAENIRFFRDGFSLKQVEVAARRAHLHDEIMALADGYETVVGPGARSLSGGQCQRLGIARALVGVPELLVLDEPTSALDPHSESLIRQSLREIAASTTIVLVAHRPATLEVCTRVIQVDNGAVTELAPVKTAQQPEASS
jgi:ATP-binding cassette subfamily B protein